VADDTTTPPVPTRKRLRPYLNWLEFSRDQWKSHAGVARAEALSLRHRVRRLTAGRDRWHQEALDLRGQLRLALEAREKNGRRS
jgi:hypothetical protein